MGVNLGFGNGFMTPQDVNRRIKHEMDFIRINFRASEDTIQK